MSDAKLESVVQEYLLPRVAVKREWSLFVFIRILPGSPGQKPERFVEFLRHAMGKPRKVITEVDARRLEEVMQGARGDTSTDGHVDTDGFFRQGLLGVLAREFIRINLPGQIGSTNPGTTESEAASYSLLRARPDTRPTVQKTQQELSAVGSMHGDTRDPTKGALPSLDSIDIAFTHNGLAALNLDPLTLDSFPEAFRQGMAARTHLTGDGELDAAEHWEGVLGQDCVHGLLTIHTPVSETGFQYWDNLDREVAQFNLDEWQWPVCEDPPEHLDRKSQEQKASSLFGASMFSETANKDADGTSAPPGLHEPGLRDVVNEFAKHFGFEILQLELGQAPYELDRQLPSKQMAVRNNEEDEWKQQQIKRPQYRREHFGFRDGVSQPFLDLNLGAPAPGGGTPHRDGSWKPVAPGEIYLGAPDEDGLIALQPFNKKLSFGGTYLVFRKLEQDVPGFRSFLAKQHDSKADQNRLAAQMVGRWPDGAPVVRHPHADAEVNGVTGEGSLNDFRYHSEDPHGRCCPIGSHIRRTNPRDTGGRDDVKRHRMMRRGISYGGPLLPSESIGDGRKRGMYFICLNSKIDLQFELVQREWINGGEFLGQVGAGRCPLTGTNLGTRQDEFLAADAIAPIVNIPAFVRNKGGEYFFVPSLDAISSYALDEDETFKPDNMPLGSYSASQAETPGLLQESRIKRYVGEIIATTPDYSKLDGETLESQQAAGPVRSVIRLQLPQSINKRPIAGREQSGRQHMAFVGQYRDVVKVLGGLMPGESENSDSARTRENFSVAHYLQSGREITRGSDLLIAMDPGGTLGQQRKSRQILMANAWKGQCWYDGGRYRPVSEFIGKRVRALIHRVGPTGHMDILQDLAFDVCHGILEEFIGLRGPDYLTELAVSLPYARRNITNIPPGWIGRSATGAPIDAGFHTTQLWARLAFGEVIGNVLERSEFTSAAIQATSEMLTHIDEQIKLERYRDSPREEPAKTILQRLVWDADKAVDPEEYLKEVRIILADLVTTISMNIALPFSKAIQAALDSHIDLFKRIPQLKNSYAGTTDGQKYSHVEMLAFELLRLSPSAKAIFRRCEVTTTLPSGGQVHEGDWVAALLPAAGRDRNVFCDPHKFSLDRDPKSFLLFGPPRGVHRCWGEERLGRLVLEELFLAAGQFKGLQRVAGKRGEVQQFLKMDHRLMVKFNPFRATL